MSGKARRHVGRVLCCGLLLAAWIPLPLSAQTDLGGQRVGTSSGAFLKIPIDARGSALAGAVCACASGPAALFWNPAGLGIEAEREVLFTGIDYTAEIPAGAAALSFPFNPVRGSVGIALAGLRTEMDETDEYHPLGTGRQFTYSVGYLMIGVSRALTDKLNFGVAAKGLREALGPEVGGPVLTTWLLDAGAIYFVGYRDARIGIALSNFGPDLRPGGTFASHRNGAQVRYTGFSPPTFFRFGVSVDPWRSAAWQTTAAFEVGHPADNREAMRVGLEAVFMNTLALRGGYDLSADALKLNLGCGGRVRMGDQVVVIDYAYAEGGYFGGVHRWSLHYQW